MYTQHVLASHALFAFNNNNNNNTIKPIDDIANSNTLAYMLRLSFYIYRAYSRKQQQQQQYR